MTTFDDGACEFCLSIGGNEPTIHGEVWCLRDVDWIETCKGESR